MLGRSDDVGSSLEAFVRMQNALGLNRTLGSAIGVIAIVSLISSGVLLSSLHDLRGATVARGRSHQIIYEIGAFRDAMLNQETGLRGFLLTGDPASLDPLRAGKPEFEKALKQLQGLIGSDEVQENPLLEAASAARTWQTDIADAVVHEMANPDTRPEALLLERSSEGRRRFDEFRSRLNVLQTEEERRLVVQQGVLAQAERKASGALWGGGLATLLICAVMGIALNRMIARPLMKLANVTRRLVQRDLDVEVPSVSQRNEVGEMARAVAAFKNSLIELDRTSLLRATADTLPAMVGYVDARRRVGFLNGEFARWFNLQVGDVSEVYGHPLTKVFSEQAFPGAGRELEAAFGGVEMRFEHRLAPAGRDLEAFYRPHRGLDGGVLGVVTLLTDITERKRMDRRLARQARDLLRSNEELEQFAYVASHDLKAPLRGIENLVSWIEEDLNDVLTGDTRTNMDLVKNRVQRLESLLDDLLAYSRAGRDQITLDVVNVKALVDDLAVLVSPPEGFSITGSLSLPTLTTARAPLTQILQNLVGNAIKHHDKPANGHVWIDALSQSDFIEFMVADDGPGVPERYRERVFAMFQTLKPRDEVEGSGMGLAIVRKLVERHGGRIWLTDRSEGCGLVVRFTWPIKMRETRNDADGQSSARR